LGQQAKLGKVDLQFADMWLVMPCFCTFLVLPVHTNVDVRGDPPASSLLAGGIGKKPNCNLKTSGKKM